MAKRGLSVLWRMTHGEYRANLDGMNVFFGAVLGVVLTGTEAIPALDFAALLFVTAAAVIIILYISSSPHRLVYAATAVFYVVALPRLLTRMVGTEAVPVHLQPTLAVWLGITLIVEFMPRERAPAPPGP